MTINENEVIWDDAPAATPAVKSAIDPKEITWDDEPAPKDHAHLSIAEQAMEGLRRGANLGVTMLNPLDATGKADIGKAVAGGFLGMPEAAMQGFAPVQPEAQNVLAGLGGEGAGMIPPADVAAVPQDRKPDESMLDYATRKITETGARFPSNEPTTQAGKDLAEGLALPFKLTKMAGENVQDRGGSPLAATATETGLDALLMLLGGKRGATRGEVPKGITPEAVDAFMRDNKPAEPIAPAASTAPTPKQIVDGRATDLSAGDPVTQADRSAVEDLSTMVSQAIAPQTPSVATGKPPVGAPPSAPAAEGAIPPPPPALAQKLLEASGGDRDTLATMLEQAHGGELPKGETPQNLADAVLSSGSADVVPVSHSAEMPAPRETPGVDKTRDVPLAGGVVQPSERAPGHVAIDKDVPQWIRVPEHTNEKGHTFPESWVDQHREIDEHEKAEFPMLDKLGYQDAHDLHGNAATEDFARRNGMDPKVYMRAQADAVKAAKTKAEKGLATDINPMLDARPYEDANQTHLLGRPDGEELPVQSQPPLPGAPGAGGAATSSAPPPAPAVSRGSLRDLTPEQHTALDQRMQVEAAAKPEFDKAVGATAAAIGGTSKIAPIKGRGRAAEKIANDYMGDVARIKDLTRGTVIAEHGKIDAAIAEVQKNFPGAVVKRNALTGADKAMDGYRDVLINVPLKTGGWGEIQINTQGMVAAKKKAHKLYEQIAQLDRMEQNGGLDLEQYTKRENLAAEMAKIYDEAFDADASERNLDSSTSTPLRNAEDLSNARGGDVSKALVEERSPAVAGESKTGIPSTSKNRVPVGNDAGNIGATSGESIPASASERDDVTRGFMRDLADEIGWDQRGGRLLRAPLKDNDGAMGEVTGRTQWVPKSDFWPGYRSSDLPGARLTEAQARKALAKAEAGEDLTKPEQRFVDYAQQEAERRTDEYLEEVQHHKDDQLGKQQDQRAAEREAALQVLEENAEHIDQLPEEIRADIEGAKSILSGDDKPGTEDAQLWAQFLAENAGKPRVAEALRQLVRLAKEEADHAQVESRTDQATEGEGGHGQAAAKESAPVGDRGGEQKTGDGSAAARAADQRESDTTDLSDLKNRGAFRGPRSQRGAAVVRPFPTKTKMPPRRPGESQKDYYRRVMNVGSAAVKKALANNQRKIGWANFRAMLAEQQRAMDTTDALFAQARKLFEKTPEKINLATIDQWERGLPITDVDAKRFFANMQDAFEQRIERIRQQRPDAMQTLITNYFPHIYKDPVKAGGFFSNAGAKAPLRGDRSFLKQRNWPTLKEAMESGLVPVSTNPVDLATLKLHQMDKFIAMNDFIDDLRERGWMKRVYGGDPIPEGYAKVNDGAFKGAHPFVIPGENGAEPRAVNASWDMVVPEAIANDINNYLSPSLYRFGAWRTLRATENIIMSARLGWSLFHAGFTTLDNAVMLADIGLRKTLRGDFVGGLMDMLKSPIGALTAPFEGAKLNRYWRGIESADPHTDALLKMLEVGGARWKQSMSDYNNALPQIRARVRQLIANGVDLSDKSFSDFLKGAKNGVGLALQGVGEVASWLIHHWLVPNQKMAARVHLAKYELDRLADAYPKAGFKKGDYAGIINAMHPDTLKQIAGHIVDIIDDRLGHMTYDHWNWMPKMAREAAQGVVGALGWQVGVVRTVTGGAVDLPQIFSPEKFRAALDKDEKVTDADMGRIPMRLTSLLTLGLMMGGIGAITQYLLTGEWPGNNWKDYVFPKTGRRNADDSEERLQYPTYLQDHWKLATEPMKTAEHKVHPIFSMAMEAYLNRDYFGTQVRDPDAPWLEQAKQIGEHVAKGFEPYSLTNMQKAAQNRVGPGRQAASMVGVNVAPSSVSQSPFQSFVAEKAFGALPQKSRTKSETEHADVMHAVEDQLRHGESPADWDKLSEQDQRNAEKAADMTVPEIRFLRLGIEDKIRAYDKATPAERDRYHLSQHMPSNKSLARSKVFQRLPPEEQENVRARLDEIARGEGDGQ